MNAIDPSLGILEQYQALQQLERVAIAFSGQLVDSIRYETILERPPPSNRSGL
jgi:hypothetical protein